MNKNFRKTHNSAGITLVTLVITIVILLIIATVTMVGIDGESAVEYAEEAKNKYEALNEKFEEKKQDIK